MDSLDGLTESGFVGVGVWFIRPPPLFFWYAPALRRFSNFSRSYYGMMEVFQSSFSILTFFSPFFSFYFLFTSLL